MTIKEFALLCGCGTQTLRYYDKVGLLRPAGVDPWTRYRHYGPEQAVDFVKIKNLQAADFTIREIKTLLTRSDEEVCEAFDRKIAEQAEKLQRIRRIRSAYLAEKNTMESVIYSMTDYLLSQCGHPEVLREFGVDPAQAPAILARLRDYLNSVSRPELPGDRVSMTVNGEVIRGQEAVLSRIRSLTGENLSDTILLNDGYGHAAEQTQGPDPDFTGWEVLWERQGWGRVRECLDAMPPLLPGKQYCLWVRRRDPAYDEDLSYPLFLMGAVLQKQPEDIYLNCAATVAEGEENRFRLLCKEGAKP